MQPKVIWQGTIRTNPQKPPRDCPPGRVVATDEFVQGSYRRIVVLEKASVDAMNALAWFGIADTDERNAVIVAALVDLGANNEELRYTISALRKDVEYERALVEEARVTNLKLTEQLASRSASGRKGKKTP